ncbi:hypothetical protein MBANPS3_005397 [Mucor bainieri]
MVFLIALQTFFSKTKTKLVTFKKEKNRSSSGDVLSDVPTSSSTIATSSKDQQFQLRDGRRYHANEKVSYVFPSDDDEADRVHQQHWILRFALQRNYHAPVTQLLQQGITVLDSGCGPATWTLEMGETYPNSKFHGIDASSVFPEAIKPANVEFCVSNIAEKIPFPDNTFDYIHQRLLILGLTNGDWDKALKELYRVLKPGGYIEIVEPDMQDMCNMGPLLRKAQYTSEKNSSILSEMLLSRNMPPKIAIELQDRLARAGFGNIELKMTPLKLNHTDKAGGDYKHAYLNIRPAMARSNPEWEDAQVYVKYIDACGEEAEANKTCVNWYAYYAQKPQ